MTTQHVRIGLGIITHRRPDGLARLIQSLGKLRVPDGAECVILIAENDDAPTVDTLLDELRATVPFEIKYVLEKERGIPFARNCVLDMALADGFDFLTFVDDDQIVHHEWLLMLYGSVTARELDLCGGPRTYLADPDVPLTRENALVLKHHMTMMRRVHGARAMKAMTDEESALNAYTNNWMLRLARQRELGTRFDESYRFTGGSDTKFCMDFRDAGATIGYASDARTYEMWPADRLTFGYLFSRSRDQHATSLMRSGRAPTKFSASVRLLRSMVKASRLLLLAPFNGRKTVPMAMRISGRGFGLLRAARGQKSSLYDPD